MARRRRASESDRATLAPGQLAVPNVRLVRKIAEGGMGSVWEGEHLTLRTSVAVKFVLDEFGHNAEAAARFDREATAAARIKSPHVVQVLDHGVSGEGVAYIVMELLEGEDLETRLDEEPRLTLELVAHIVLQSSKALEKAHGLGIVHRDIKPANVYLTDVGGEIFVKILDFGIAKQTLGAGDQMRMTQTGAMIGTPVFMAPEQMTQAKDVGPPADMWSLGVVAYVALTGKLPYESDTVAGLAMAIERGVFPAATTIVPNLPPALDGWFEKALAKDPAKRFASIREMGDHIARLSGALAASSALATNRAISTPPPTETGSKPPPALAPEASPNVAKGDDDKATGTPPFSPSASGELRDAGRAATAGASPSPRGSHVTVMGASSERSRHEARSSTRSWVLASVAIVVLGGAAASYGVLRSRGAPEPATSSSNGPPAVATADDTPSQPAPEPVQEVSVVRPAEPDPSTSAPEASASMSAPSASASSASTLALPTIPAPPPPLPPSLPPASASASPAASPPRPPTTGIAPPGTSPPKPSTSAPKPPTSAPPLPAPSASVKTPPKPAPAPSGKPAP